jgi:hypothetical protein
MFTTSKSIRSGLLIAALTALSACASQAPRVSNAALGYAVTTHAVSADGNEEALSSALGSALNKAGIATAMPAKASVTIDFVRYNSPIIGLFYGGQHYASLSVTLTDNSGSKISSFPVYVSANGDRASADSDLADKAAEIIAAKAANAFMPMKAQPKALPKPMAAEPVIETVAPPAIETADDSAPCVIGPDGKCLVL